MFLKEKLDSIATPKLRSLQYGEAKSLSEFNGKLLSQYEIDKEVAIEWHKVLMKYVKSENPLFAIRGYNSSTPAHYDNLRRGFLTETPEFSFFYTDNFFAAYFLKMCLDNYVPTYDDFYKTMTTRQFPSRFGFNTSNERKLMAIPQGKNPGLNSAGFKHAHIIPVGMDYVLNDKKMGMTEILNSYFPKGERNDWKLSEDASPNFYKRTLAYVNPDAKRLAIAYFLRFVHPFNYFLCPMRDLQTNDKNCRDIAEYQPLLDFMHDEMLDKFGEVYTEFLSLILVDEKYKKHMFDCSKNSIKIFYGKRVNTSANTEKPKTTFSTIANKCSKTIEEALVWEFLNNPYTSFRKLEQKFLGLDGAARGGGFVAKNIVNSYGFTIAQKGILFNFNQENFNSISDASIRQSIIKFIQIHNQGN